MKWYPFIHAERQRYPVRLLCAVLQVSRSGYYRFVQGGGGQAQPDPALLVQVQRLHRASSGTDGSRRLCVALQQAGCQELYIAIEVDLFSRKVVGWACAASMVTRLITRALRMAVGQRQPAPGLLHHSDRGSRYASAEYQGHLRAAGMLCSMSRKGNCYDNTVVERVFRSLKEDAFSEQPPDS